jgi:hypothetical protein
VEAAAHDLEAKEVFDDGEVLVVCAWCSRAPERVEELFDVLGAGGRLEVLDLEVEEVAGELVQARLVVAVAGVGQALSLRAQVAGSVGPDRR